MQHVLRISRKIDYGLRAMIYLASIPQESVVPFREIARQMDVPEDFLAKILKTLVDQGLVRSTRGPHGGYALARPPATISFLDVIEAVEGPSESGRCVLADKPCGGTDQCALHVPWSRARAQLVSELARTPLSTLLSTSEEEHAS